jgi:hypothetical protein
VLWGRTVTHLAVSSALGHSSGNCHFTRSRKYHTQRPPEHSVPSADGACPFAHQVPELLWAFPLRGRRSRAEGPPWPGSEVGLWQVGSLLEGLSDSRKVYPDVTVLLSLCGPLGSVWNSP